MASEIPSQIRYSLYSQGIYCFIEGDGKVNKQFRYVIRTQIEVSMRGWGSTEKSPKAGRCSWKVQRHRGLTRNEMERDGTGWEVRCGVGGSGARRKVGVRGDGGSRVGLKRVTLN